MQNTSYTKKSKGKKIVVLGGTGLIGKQLIAFLNEQGHQAVPASPSLGVNTLTGEGLSEILRDAEVVVDVTNSPSFEDQAVLEFFQISTRNVLVAEAEAGVSHHVALSIVGADGLPDSGYMRAKVAQEALIKESPVPFTILRATQFFEFVGGIAHASTQDETVILPEALIQPIFSRDVALALAEVAASAPLNGTLDLAGPEAIPFGDFIGRYLESQGDSRRVEVRPNGRYFGTLLEMRSLVPTGKSRLGTTRFSDWLAKQVSVA